MGMTIHGDAKLISEFNALPRKIQDKLLRTELRGALKPVLAQAKATARKLFGAMAATLKIKAMKRKAGRIGFYIRTGTRSELESRLTKRGRKLAQAVLGGGRYARKTRVRLQIVGRTLRSLSSGRAYYPAHIEFGTKRNKAYPFLRPAFDRHIASMEAAVAASVQEAIDTP